MVCNSMIMSIFIIGVDMLNDFLECFALGFGDKCPNKDEHEGIEDCQCKISEYFASISVSESEEESTDSIVGHPVCTC